MRLLPTIKTISTFLAILVLLFAGPGTVSADGGDNPFEQEAGGYHINLVFDEPVKAGSNEIVVKLRTEHDKPIAGATVEVAVEQAESHAEEELAHAGDSTEMHHDEGAGETGTDTMESMGHESDLHEPDRAQKIVLEAGHEPGEYHGVIELPKTGDSKLSVHFQVEDAANMVIFPLEISSGFSKAGILVGFISVNIAAIVTAAILKRKSTSSPIEGDR